MVHRRSASALLGALFCAAAVCAVDGATLHVHGDETRRLLLNDGQADDTITCSYKPEAGMRASDYTVRILSSSHEVLREDDVDVLPGIASLDRAVNVSMTVDFHRAVGKADVRVSVTRPDGAEYVGAVIHYVVVGMSFYTLNAVSEARDLVVGNKFSIDTYEHVLHRRVSVFYTVICFPDGTLSSHSADPRLIDATLQGVRVSSGSTSLLKSHSFDSCSTDHATWYANGTLALAEACSFGFSTAPEVYFGLELLPYRTGSATVRFTSESLVAGSEFEEAFETFIEVTVGGSPPPAVVSVLPAGPYSQAGGQIVTVAVINTRASTTATFLFNGTSRLQPLGGPEYVAASGMTVASFTTSPGKGTNIPYTIRATTDGAAEDAVWAGEGPALEFSYVSEAAHLAAIEPRFGPAAGGTVVTVTGSFLHFDASKESGDRIAFGSHTVPKSSIVSVSETSIAFKTPPSSEASAHNFDVLVHATIGGVRTNAVLFEYESLHEVDVTVLGSSYDSAASVHRIPLCPGMSASPGPDVVLVPELNLGARKVDIAFTWVLVEEASRREVLRSAAHWFVVPRSQLSAGVRYDVVIVAKDGTLGTTVEAAVHLVAEERLFYGLSLTTSRHRTLSSPLTDVRVTASLFDDAGCLYNTSSRITFEWTFGKTVSTFSPESTSFDEGAAGARRFGREYLIPRQLLTYGTHEVRCKAYSTDEPSVAGTAAVNFTVTPSALRAQIGAGQSFLQVSPSSDVTITGEGSLDVDAHSLDPSTAANELQYEWRCELSTSGGSSFNSVDACPAFVFAAEAAGAKSFTISKDAAGRLQRAGASSFLRLHLVVRKSIPGHGPVLSAEAVQVVEVSDAMAGSADRTAPGSLVLQCASGAPVDARHFRPDEALVVTPGEPAGMEWRFKLLEPDAESYSFLQNPSNLLPYPGYVQAGTVQVGRRPLGIRAGALRGDTQYKFRIEFESPSDGNKSGGHEEFTLHTAATPRVTFPPVSEPAGTTDTIFKAAAAPTFISPDFKYYFFVELADGGSVCVDGCSGNDIAVFRIPVVGTHKVSCAMADSRGNGDYQFAEEVQTITVSAAARDSSAAHTGEGRAVPVWQRTDARETFNNLFHRGDHAAFEISCLSVAEGASTAAPGSFAQESVSRLVGEALRRLRSLAKTTEPNTPLGRDYLKIALAFSSLPVGSEALADPQTFLDACRVVEQAVSNTPTTEAYGLEPELVQFLTNMAQHAGQHASSGSMRRRLLAVGDAASDGDRLQPQVLDLSELAPSVVSTALSRDKPCGYSASRVIPGVSNVSVSVACNGEQGTHIQGTYASLHWCPQIFAASGDSPVIFVLAEMEDYISASNVLTYKTSPVREADERRAMANGTDLVVRERAGPDSKVIVKTYVLRASGPTGPFGSSRLVAADTGLDGGASCFALNQTVLATTDVFMAPNPSADVVSCRSVTAVQFENVKRFAGSLPDDAYAEVLVPGSDKSFRTFAAGAVETSVLARVPAINGMTFGARRSGCDSSRPLLLGASALAGLTVGLLVAVIVSTLLTWLGMTYYLANSGATVLPIASGSPYIERDIYGRDNIGGAGAKRPRKPGPAGDDVQVVFANVTPQRPPPGPSF